MSMSEMKPLAKKRLTCDRSRNCRTLLYPHLRFLAVEYSISFLYCHILNMSAESEHLLGRHLPSESVLQTALSGGWKGKLWALIW